jgi:hypothetical protein
MIEEGCNVGGRLWLGYGAALLHLMQLYWISTALQKAHIVVSSSEWSCDQQ